MLKKILISQPKPTSDKSPYFEIARKFGVEFVFHPFIKVEGLTAREFRQQKVQVLDHTAIVFNSRHAIDHFFTLCKEMRVTIMAKHKAEKYLIPQSDVHSDELHLMLEAKKLNHTECIMYRTVSNAFPEDHAFNFDMVVLFTPAGVESLLQNIPDFKDRGIKLACFGKATAKAIEEAGLPLELEAPSAKAPSITGSLELYLEEHNK